MYGLVLVVGDLVERLGRRNAIGLGLAVMACSNLLLWPFDGIFGMSLSLFGLGLGWSLSYVAATAELVTHATPVERGRLIGATDLAAGLLGAALALLGGAAYSEWGAAAIAVGGTIAVVLPALGILLARRPPTPVLEPAG